LDEFRLKITNLEINKEIINSFFQQCAKICLKLMKFSLFFRDEKEGFYSFSSSPDYKVTLFQIVLYS